MVAFNQLWIQALKREIKRIAFNVLRKGIMSRSEGVRDQQIRAWTGCSTTVLAKAWDLLCRAGPLQEGATMECFLWAFVILKSYDVEENNTSRVGALDEGTFRQWSWWFIEELSYLESEVVCLLLLFLLIVVVDI